MRIAHVIQTDKFTTGYINFMNMEFSEMEHKFVIRDNGNEFYEVKPLDDSNVYTIKNYSEIFNDDHVKEFFYTSDKIIFSGIFETREAFPCLTAKMWKKTYLQFWGGDFYSLRNQIPYYQIKAWLHKIKYLWYIYRCNSVLLLIPSEYKIFSSITGLKKKYYYLPMPIDPLKRTDASKYIDDKKINIGKTILLGNSSTPTNCHRDIIDRLASMRNNKSIKIICPLSYGDFEYREDVIRYGKNKFGDRFIPITEYTSLEDYIEILKKCDVGIFNNNRQQGMGNIGILLALGKKVYIRKDTSMWDYFSGMGIKIYEIAQLEFIDDTDNIFFYENIIEGNVEIMNKVFSGKIDIQQWKKFMYEN